jgi:L-threonylcarbamoyladenylate synthase
LEKIAGQDRLVRLDTGASLKKGLKKAVQCLLSGGLVAFPTESFYGLAVDSTNETAIKRLFSVKKRRPDIPILILIPSVGSLKRFVKRIPSVADRLMEEFWPGALTLIFEAGPNVSPLLTADTGKIGIRLPSHPIATALAKGLGLPITGTSANISGRPACRNAQEILSSFGRGVDLILDGGKTEGKIASTVLDITVHPPEILREGMIRRTRLEAFISV